MEQVTEPTPSRRGWWIAGGGVLLAIVIGAAIWFIVGPRVWTDGWRLHIPASQTSVREVIWTPPAPLEGFASDEQVYEPSISPDGTELYFVRGKAGTNARIFVSRRSNNHWTKPAPVDAVNGAFDALGPRISPDGNSLYFYSNRPGGLGGYDVWVSQRSAGGWGKPANLGPGINSEFNEFSPDPTPDGRHLIFATNRKAAKREQNEAWRSTIRETVSSDYDLWIANASPATTQPSGPATFSSAREISNVNTPYTEGASCISPAGDFLYFASNRPGGAGKFDIYRSRVRGDEFDLPENVGKPINTDANEADPALTFNGFRMIFSSDRPGAAGRYQLLMADSREVYPERNRRPLPHLGWSWWLLLISALVLVPLLMMMRGFDERKLSLLQRCLLMSLLVHALITFILSFMVVTQKVRQYVRAQAELEIPVNTAESQAFSETLAVRSQSTGGELPTSAPPTVAMAPARQQVQESIAAPSQSNDVASPRLNASAMAIPLQQTPLLPVAQATTPRVDVKPTAESQIGASSALQLAPTPSIKLGQIGGAEATPRATSAQQRASRAQSATADDAGKPGDVGVSAAAIGAGGQSALANPSAVPNVALAQAGTGPRADAGTSTPMSVTLNGKLPQFEQASAAEPTLGSTASGIATTRPAANSAVAATDNARPASIATVGGAIRSSESHIGEVKIAAGDAGTGRGLGAVAPVLAGSGIASGQALSPTPKVQIAQAVGTADAPVVSTNAGPVVSNRPSTGSDSASNRNAAPAVSVRGPQRQSVPTGSGIGVAASVAVGGPRVNLQTSGAPAPKTDVSAVAVGAPNLARGGGLSSSVVGSSEKSVATAATPGASIGKLGGAGTSADAESHTTSGVALVNAPITPGDSAGMRGGPGSTPGVGTGVAQLASADIKPQVALSTLTGPLGPTKSIAPDLAFIRSPDRRQPMLQEFGGTKESEEAVTRGLAYLASVQESDGRWTRIDDGERRRRGRDGGRHDMACTGFAVLAFLGHGDSPTVAGPYQKVVADGIAYLIDRQDENGDLRGLQQFRGGGSDAANMYDQGIATYALAEAAAITHDPRMIDAAKKAAQFIVDAQDEDGGGWRYSPKEQGDTSVFGWQIMALHSAEAIGFEIPTQTIDGAKRYVQRSSEGRYHLLAGYQPHNGPTPAMTAELLFSRMLLDTPITEEGMAEATRYLARQPPDPNQADLYYWYYASLSMLHMQNPLWKDWNVLTRESLIRLQQSDGSWDLNLKWGERGGRVFTTSMATLTLEVYYRYLPLRLNKPASQP